MCGATDASLARAVKAEKAKVRPEVAAKMSDSRQSIGEMRTVGLLLSLPGDMPANKYGTKRLQTFVHRLSVASDAVTEALAMPSLPEAYAHLDKAFRDKGRPGSNGTGGTGAGGADTDTGNGESGDPSNSGRTMRKPIDVLTKVQDMLPEATSQGDEWDDATCKLAETLVKILAHRAAEARARIAEERKAAESATPDATPATDARPDAADAAPLALVPATRTRKPRGTRTARKSA
jgi:hypothetical protein